MAVTVIDRDNQAIEFDEADSWWVDDEGYLHVIGSGISRPTPAWVKVGAFESRPVSTANVATFNKVAWQYVYAEPETRRLSP